MKIILYVLFGFAGGIAGGMGMGGGTLLIPLLTTFSGFNQLQAQAINLVSFLPTSAVALIIHVSQGNVRKNDLFVLVFSASVSALLFSFASQEINTKILRIVFGAFLVLLSGYTFYDSIFCQGKNPSKNERKKSMSKSEKNRKKVDDKAAAENRKKAEKEG